MIQKALKGKKILSSGVLGGIHSANTNKGTNATKMRKLKGEGGKESARRIPVSMTSHHGLFLASQYNDNFSFGDAIFKMGYDVFEGAANGFFMDFSQFPADRHLAIIAEISYKFL